MTDYAMEKFCNYCHIAYKVKDFFFSSSNLPCEIELLYK